MHDPPLCTLRELQDGTYTIFDLAQFNEAIAVKNEMLERYREKNQVNDG
jgi:hypothetical protein